MSGELNEFERKKESNGMVVFTYEKNNVTEYSSFCCLLEDPNYSEEYNKSWRFQIPTSVNSHRRLDIEERKDIVRVATWDTYAEPSKRPLQQENYN